MKLWKKLTTSFLISAAVLGAGIAAKPLLFSPAAITAEAAGGVKLSGDTLILSGNVEVDAVQEYHQNENVKKITCKKGTVFPADCYGLFGYFYYVENIDLSNADTSHVTSMNSMFCGCIALESVDLSSFDTSKVESMQAMFSDCHALASLDVSSFDTSRVWNFWGMFSDCSSLTELDVTHFDTSKGTEFGYMFSGCKGLRELDVTHFDTSSMKFPFTMFDGCSELTTLDLSSFDTSNVVEPREMFRNCTKLKTIYVSSKWNMKPVTAAGSYNMFQNCTALVGGNGTVFSESHTDYEYARIDKAGQPGYLTARPTPEQRIRIIDTWVSLIETFFPYTGSQVKVGSYIKVRNGSTPLKYNTDFTLTYKNNVSCGAGTASVTVTGIGKYTGSVTMYYSIVPAQQKAPKLSTKNGRLHIEWTADQNAQGYQVQYCRNSSFSGDTLHSTSTAAKTYCDLATYPKKGEKWYVRVRAFVKDSAGKIYGIWSDAKSITLGTVDNVTLSKKEFDYTGKQVKVGNYIKVKSGGTALKYGADFELVYRNNTKKGTASVTVKGIGEYAGSSVTVSYRIR